jgi:hypothetical protein
MASAKRVADWDVRNIRFIVTYWPGETAVTEMVVTAWDCESVALRETTLGALIDWGHRGRQSFWAQGRVSVQTGASSHSFQSGMDAFGPSGPVVRTADRMLGWS